MRRRRSRRFCSIGWSRNDVRHPAINSRLRHLPHVHAGVALDVAAGDVPDEVPRRDRATRRVGRHRRWPDLDPRAGGPGPGAAPLPAERIPPELGWRGARQTKSSPQVREEPAVPAHPSSRASPIWSPRRKEGRPGTEETETGDVHHLFHEARTLGERPGRWRADERGGAAVLAR